MANAPGAGGTGLSAGATRGVIALALLGFAGFGLAVAGRLAGNFLEWLVFLVPPFLILMAMASAGRRANAVLAGCTVAMAVIGVWVVGSDGASNSPQRGWAIVFLVVAFYLALVPIGIATWVARDREERP